MQTYYVASKIDGRMREVKAANINNLRRNLMKGMKARDIRFIYSAKDAYSSIGLLGRMPKADGSWKDYEFLWVAGDKSYRVAKDGSLREW